MAEISISIIVLGCCRMFVRIVSLRLVLVLCMVCMCVGLLGPCRGRGRCGGIDRVVVVGLQSVC